MSQDNLEARRAFLRNTIQTSLAVTAGVTGNMLAPLVHAMGKIPDELIPGKSIYDMGGTVLVNGKRANEDTFIDASAKVETRSNSYVVFVIGTDAHILKENSVVQFRGNGSIEEGLNVVGGRLLSVFGARPPAAPTTTLETSTATIGIRGTGVYLESHDDSSYVCTCYGRVDLASKTDPSKVEKLQTIHHDSPRYILKDPDGGKLITPAPMKNHTDEELMLVEQLVGRTPPFATLKSYSGPRKGY